jgi:hypothetical protein
MVDICDPDFAPIINRFGNGCSTGCVHWDILFFCAIIALAIYGRLAYYSGKPKPKSKPSWTPPPKQETHWTPPPKADPPPRSTPAPEPRSESRQPITVTSMRQGYEILGLPPGKVTLSEVKAAYRAQMLGHHPDRVSHLGPELQALALIKSTEFNLAMDYIASHLPKA